VTNAAPNTDCIEILNTTVTGNVTNTSTGTITPGSTAAGIGINVDNSTINGQISNAGTITVTGIGILVQSNSVVTNGIVNTGTITTTANSSAIVVNNVSTFAGGINNSGTIQSGGAGIVVGTPCSCVSISTFTGGITNSGSITAAQPGIAVSGVETFTGGISNSGSIDAPIGIGLVNVETFTGGIINSGNIAAQTGILLFTVATFSGGITNSGTINGSGAGIAVNNVSAFSGNIVNTGTINAATGILICACTSTFAGSIINSGSINAAGAGIFVEVETFTGGITNTGTITSTSSGGFTPGGIIVTSARIFGGNIVNAGTITVSTGFGIAVGATSGGSGEIRTFAGSIVNTGTISVLNIGTGITVHGVRTFLGGITNSGTITAPLVGISIGQSTFGPPGTGVSLFAGGIVNSGSINGGLAGIVVAEVSSFAGGISNSGAIGASVIGILVGGCGCVGVSTFSGGINNSGTITAGSTAILVDSTVATFLGGITNTGSITAGFTGISLGIGGISVFNSGTITGNGGTAIQFGGTGNTLTLGPGSAINGLVLGTGSDTFQLGGSSGSGTFDVSGIGTQYLGFGTFNKVDASTWTLTGTNNAVLPWTVLGGTLNVAAGASLPNSPFTVQGGIFAVNGTVGAVTLNGGTLMGNGTLAALFANGGIVAPGNSIGQLNVNGPVTFAAGATYQVEANAAGQSDRILATGTATLSGGTVQAILAPGAYGPVTTYTILTANSGRIGAFSTVTSSLPFLIPTLTYDPNNAFLTLTRNAAFFQNQAGTRNQRAVASALDTFPTDNPLFLAAANLTGGATRQALDLLSGEIHASVHSVMLDDSLYLRQAVLGRLRQASFTQGPLTALGGGGPLAYAAPDETETAALAYAAKGRAFPIKTPRDVAPPAPGPDRTWWAQGVGAWGKINSDGNAADVSRSLGGFFTGFDQRFGEWRVGIAGGYTNSSVSVSARASSANIEAAHLAAYAGTSFGAWNLRTGAAVSFDQISTSRSIVFPGFSDAVSARYHGTNGQVFGEAGYGMAFGPVAVEPFAGLAYVHIGSTSFTETGGLAALTGSGSKNDIGYSTLGARAATHVPLANGMLLTPRASLAWQHAFGDVTPTAALAFKTAGIPFTIAGAPIARDSALVDAGFDLDVGWQATIGLAYVGVLANSAHDHSVKGNFSWKF
jgi:outer membrane autotransporter protein